MLGVAETATEAKIIQSDVGLGFRTLPFEEPRVVELGYFPGRPGLVGFQPTRANSLPKRSFGTHESAPSGAAPWAQP